MSPADLSRWLLGHREEGRKLQVVARGITDPAEGMAWRDPGPEGKWRDELVRHVADAGYADWSYDLLYMGENFHRAKPELGLIQLTKEACPEFVESVQFHAARLMVLDDFRRLLRDQPVPAKKHAGGRPRAHDRGPFQVEYLRRVKAGDDISAPSMYEWAGENYVELPDLRTVQRWIAELRQN